MIKDENFHYIGYVDGNGNSSGSKDVVHNEGSDGGKVALAGVDGRR